MAMQVEQSSLFHRLQPPVMTLGLGVLALAGFAMVVQAVFPETISIRKEIHDAKEKGAEVASLNRLTCRADTLDRYANEIKTLVSNPALFRDWNSADLLALQSKIEGARLFGDKLTEAERLDMRGDETKLIGLVVMALQTKFVPTYDASQSFSVSDPPYELVATNEGDRDDPAKKAAYSAHLAVLDKERERGQREFEKRRCVRRGISKGNWYLRQVFEKQEEDSIDAEVRPLMIEAGVDAWSIDLLVGKISLPPE